MTEKVLIDRALLQDLIDDVSDYAASRDFKEREAKWRTELLEKARAILAAGASEGQAERLQRAVWEVERPEHDGFYWLWRISYKGERMPAEIVQRHQSDFLFPGDSKAFKENSTVFVGAYWLPAYIASQPDPSAELTALRERIAGMEKDAEPVGEFVGYQKIGFQQVPIIAWNRHVPMGTKLYVKDPK